MCEKQSKYFHLLHISISLASSQVIPSHYTLRISPFSHLLISHIFLSSPSSFRLFPCGEKRNLCIIRDARNSIRLSPSFLLIPNVMQRHDFKGGRNVYSSSNFIPFSVSFTSSSILNSRWQSLFLFSVHICEGVPVKKQSDASHQRFSLEFEALNPLPGMHLDHLVRSVLTITGGGIKPLFSKVKKRLWYFYSYPQNCRLLFRVSLSEKSKTIQ